MGRRMQSQSTDSKSRRPGFCAQGRGGRGVNSTLPAPPNNTTKPKGNLDPILSKLLVGGSNPISAKAASPTSSPLRKKGRTHDVQYDQEPPPGKKPARKDSKNKQEATTGPSSQTVFQGESDLLPPINKIKQLINHPDHQRACKKPLFNFEMTQKAAAYNERVLRLFKYDF
jgi:hypothetical protein